MYVRIFLFFFYLLALSVSGQNNPDTLANEKDIYPQEKLSNKYFSSEEWEKAKNGIKYEEDKKEQKKESAGSLMNLPLFNFEILKYFFIFLIFAALVVFIVWINSRLNTSMPKVIKPLIISEADNLTKDELMLLDLENSIAQAISNKDFYLATRLLYLRVLQHMVGKGIIEWRKDQTNRTILGQLQDQAQQLLLKRIFRQYENVWYGQKRIVEDDFNNFLSQCNQFSADIKPLVQR